MNHYTFVYFTYLVIVSGVFIFCSWLLGGKKASIAIATLILLGIINSLEINSVSLFPSLPFYTTSIKILGYPYIASIGLNVPFIGFLIGVIQPNKEIRIGSWFFLLHQLLMLPISVLYTIALLTI